ncbi:WD repeat-containing 91 [Labeo rohita]|uniref:WD repeat-containing protein 91 n=1 Tax=Labeo rohita TaxID=84645 RepID=A0A498N237_LABRO|nr:WD repeat-containing 91 [Labeo rohita]
MSLRGVWRTKTAGESRRPYYGADSEYDVKMASAVERTDDLVREYLIYRGFTSTLKYLDSEIKADKEKGFRVDKIIDQLQQLIQSYDLTGLKEYWAYLDRRLFSRLEDVYRPTVNKLRTSLYRFYVIHTVQMKNHEKTQEFFQKQALELQAQVEWRDWFALPFIPAPEQNPTFSPYFSRQWADTFLVSLHNFLSVLFQDLVSSQRNVNMTTPSRNFFSTFLPQTRRAPGKMAPGPQSSPTQASLGRKDPTASAQSAKAKDLPATKDLKMPTVSTATADLATGYPRQRRHQDHEKERKELLSKHPPQSSEKKNDSDSDAQTEAFPEQTDSTNQTRVGEVAGAAVEQPFIKLSQEEYGEHHSSIMHCRVDCSGRRVASLDVDGVVKVWAFNPIMQTKATIMSKSPLLSLEWAAKPDRLLLLGSGVGTVKLYDTDAKKNLYEMSIDDIHPRILSLACSPSGTSFVCSAAAQAAHSGIVTEGDARISAPVSGQLLLWDTKTVKQQLQFALEPGPVAINCTAFNHNGNLLVTGAADGMIRLFDMQRYESALSWKAHDGEVYSVEFSYDENTVFSIGEDGKFVQWNIHRCGVKQSEYSLSQDAVGPFVLSGYSGYKQVQVPRGRLFAFDSEGQHVITCSSSGGVIYRLNKADTGLESVLSLGGHKAPVVTVDWCSAMDCGTCLTASMDGKIKLSTLLAQKP